MDNKDFTMALFVPGIWVAWLLFNIVFTLASPVLFFIALFNEHTPLSLIIHLIEGGLEDVDFE